MIIPMRRTQCIFCSKKRKKILGKEWTLEMCVTHENIELFKSQANEMSDVDLLQKIDDKCVNNLIIYYHKIL